MPPQDKSASGNNYSVLAIVASSQERISGPISAADPYEALQKSKTALAKYGELSMIRVKKIDETGGFTVRKAVERKNKKK